MPNSYLEDKHLVGKVFVQRIKRNNEMFCPHIKYLVKKTIFFLCGREHQKSHWHYHRKPHILYILA
ncbi:IS1 family transposase [Escherichia coli]|uniref:IS1 family transposase n=1 Tax=Escherichia coli TaxID=562 RepID=UPI000BE136F1